MKVTFESNTQQTMKNSYFTALVCCLLLFSCSKSEQSSQERETMKKTGDPDFIGYLPLGLLGGSGTVELHGRVVHDRFNGRDKPRDIWCTRPKKNCLEFHKLVDGNRKDFLTEEERLELNKLCNEQIGIDIENYFNTGNGSTLLYQRPRTTLLGWFGEWRQYHTVRRI